MAADDADQADVVVVNTCAFIEAARQESIETILSLAARRKSGAKLVVTGCMAERYGDELATRSARGRRGRGLRRRGSIGTSVGLAAPKRKPAGVRDLLELPRPAPSVPWAYVKVAEGCDRACAFCAIPSFRGKQRSRTPESIEAEVRSLVEGGVAEVVLVAQDLAWYGRDAGEPGSLAPLLRRLDTLAADGLARVRLLYLYPSEVRDPLVATMLELDTVVPYFDLSLAARRRRAAAADEAMGERRPVHRRHRRHPQPRTRCRVPLVVHRGLPGRDASASTTSCWRSSKPPRSTGPASSRSRPRTARPAATLPDAVPPAVVGEWMRECEAVQEPITRAGARRARRRRDRSADRRARRRHRSFVGRTHREAPEIDGVVRVDADFARAGALVRAHVTEAIGPDLVAKVTPR